MKFEAEQNVQLKCSCCGQVALKKLPCKRASCDVLRQHGRRILTLLSDGKSLSPEDTKFLPIIHKAANRLAIRLYAVYAVLIALAIAIVVWHEYTIGPADPFAFLLLIFFCGVHYFWSITNGSDCHHMQITRRLLRKNEAAAHDKCHPHKG